MLEDRLALLRASARFSPEVVQDLATFLAGAPEEELFRMNPLRYAARHQLPERLAVDLFLHATNAGLLDFTWGVLCPACGAFLITPAALRALARRNCSMCEIAAPVTDSTVEVAFTVAPSVRRIRFHSAEALDLRRDWGALYFSPSSRIPDEFKALFKDSLVAVWTLPPGEELVLEHTLSAGQFAVLAPALHARVWLNVVPHGAPTRLSLDLLDDRFFPERVEVGQGPVAITVHNRTSAPVPVGLLKRPSNSSELAKTLCEMPVVRFDPFLTGKALVTSQTFRDLFRAESIPAEGGLEFKSLTFLFTDLTGSTALYERVGDFNAFGLVREHFTLLKDIVADRGGSLVKTIGDAVMASFPEPTPALAAAALMSREIKKVARGELELKIGLHTGPAIAVEMNERLDYFGRTVNIAARAQAAAQTNQIVCTEPVFRAPGADEVIRTMSLTARQDRAVFKGVEGEMTVHRLQ